jgi:molybdate transport system substrate-binding protein
MPAGGHRGIGAGAIVRVFSANGVKTIVNDLAPRFGDVTGCRLAVSFGEAGEVRGRILDGDQCDLVLLPAATLADLAGLGKIAGDSIIEIARTEIGMAVRSGAAKPDIGSSQAFRDWLLGVSSIVITDPESGGVSGVHFADVLRHLGIAGELAPRFSLTRGALNAVPVARGEAELAVQLAHEIHAVPGVEFVPLPAEFRRTITFSAGLSAGLGKRDTARALISFLSGSEAAAIISAAGMQSAASH